MGMSYSIYNAKTHLSEIIRQVKKNRSVVITERGHDVALVIPAPAKQSREERLKMLEQSGIIIPAMGAKPGDIRPIAQRPGGLKRFLASRD